MKQTIRNILFLTLCLLALPVFGLMFTVATNPVQASGLRPHPTPTTNAVSTELRDALNAENKTFILCLGNAGAYAGVLGTPSYVTMTQAYHAAMRAETMDAYNANLSIYRTNKVTVSGTSGC